MGADGGRQRLFIALPLPRAVEDVAAGTLDRLRKAARTHGTALHYVPPRHWHVTTRFLGDVPVNTIGAFRDGLQSIAAAHPVPRATVTGLVGFPRAAGARIVALQLAAVDGALADLAAACERLAVDNDLAAESHAYRPHITLARAKRPLRLDGLALARPRAVASPYPLLRLYRSTLTPAGSLYETVGEWPLGGTGEDPRD